MSKLEVARSGGGTHTFFYDTDDEAPELQPQPAGEGAGATGSSSSDETVCYDVADYCREHGIDPPPKRPRAAPGHANPDTWKRNVQKVRKAQGQPYKGLALGQEVWKRGAKMGPPCIRQSCVDSGLDCRRIPEAVRGQINNYFRKVLSTDAERIRYLQTLTHNNQKKGQQRIKNTWTLKSNTGRVYKVCKVLVSSTLDKAEKTLYNWLKRKPTLGCKKSKASKTGKHRPVTREERAYVDRMLMSLPTVPSHYARNVPRYQNVRFLESNERIARIYRVYKAKAANDKVRVLSETYFRQRVKALKIRIHKLKKDLCEFCEIGKKGGKTDAQLATHIKAKERAQDERKADEKEASEANSTTMVWTTDMQAVQTCPKSSASPMYFRQKLILHNQCYFRRSTKEGHCVIWSEHEGGVKGENIASAHWRVIGRLLCEPRHHKYKKLVLWSDGCAAQTKCCTVSTYLIDLAKRCHRTIEQKWLVPGHTWMDVDAMHATIERRARSETIEVPRDFVNICKAARVRPEPYRVRVFNHRKFIVPKVNFVTSIRPGNAVGDPVVTDLRALQYRPDGSVYYKIDFDHPWRKLPQPVHQQDKIDWLPYYKGSPPGITQAKYNDLQALKPVLDPSTHAFYDALPVKLVLRD